MISAILGGISLLGGIGSSIASAVNAHEAEKEQREKLAILEKQRKEDSDLFDKQYYQDVTKRTEIHDMLRRLDENQRQAESRSEAAAAITGATPEQQLASREINRKTYADAVAQIASNASNLRDQYLRDYQGQRDRYYAQRLGMQDQLAGIYSNQANQWANAAGNAFASGAQMLGSGLDATYGNGQGGQKSVRIPKKWYMNDYNAWVSGANAPAQPEVPVDYLQQVPVAQSGAAGTNLPATQLVNPSLLGPGNKYQNPYKSN